VSPMPSRSPAILKRPDTFFARPAGGPSGLLVDAQDYYLAFYRAALEARETILLTGWQFDRGVKLLRGADVKHARPMGGEVRLLKLLDGLCRQRPALRVFILAWDFHVVLALEREWMQRLYFHWMTHERLQFRFDAAHPSGGCHHQKFAVIDGRVAFLGGIDLCESRWDDRQHRMSNRLRISRGRAQKPYHDVQAYFDSAEMAGTLEDVFCDRWRQAGGDPITLPRRQAASGATRPRGALPFPPRPVALSRTDPREEGAPRGAKSIDEIRALLVRAMGAAQRLIYVETQYFSSWQLCEALLQRLGQARRPRLEIVLVVNERAEALKEQIAVGLRQEQIVQRLRPAAAENGHALGVYYTLADGPKPRATYIHSKLAIVDDRFLTIGSANFTNRSLSIDSEINASWEAPPEGDRALETAIRRARVSLLTEHIGRGGSAITRRLARPSGLVRFLDSLVASGKGRLRALPPPTLLERKTIELIDPRDLPFDPERPD
jgi:phospholipase D1/2